MPTFSFYCVICGTVLESSSDSKYDLLQCRGCSRHVPVPRPVGLVGKFTNSQSVLPPRVLELSVTFQCTKCESRLRTDARWEGREISCPDCGGTTDIPRWSTVPSWPLSAEARDKARVPALPPPPICAKPPVLSVEEIDFLRGETSSKPEVAA